MRCNFLQRILQRSWIIHVARITKTLSGKWQAHICVKRIRKTQSFKTKAQAQEWVRDMEHKLARGDAGASYVHTLADVLKRYQKEVSEYKKGARWEIVRINKLLRDPLSEIKLIHLKREDFEEWIQRQLQTIKSSSINREIEKEGPWRGVDDVERATLIWFEWFNHRRLLQPIGDRPSAE